MKTTALFLLISIHSFAATISLKAGDSISLRANQEATVTCEGGTGVDCAPHVKRFKSRFDFCLTTSSTEQCINTIWVDFKKNSPTCVEEASDYCLLKCNETMNTTWCLNKCN